MAGKRGKLVVEGAFDDYRMYLRNERIRQGLTQKDLANQVGITREALCQYEKGVREPCYDIMLRISRALCNVDISKLYEKYKYIDGLFISDSGHREIGIM